MVTGVMGGVLLAALATVIAGCLPALRAHRAPMWGAALLAIMSVLYPWPGNGLAARLFGGPLHITGAIANAYGIAWWVMGAWLVKNALNRVLRRTIFPNDNQPHARRLFADLASGFVYVVAFVGIMDTVLEEPISTLLATSGVLAIVLGLALQNTLADVFSGLAINIEQPFGAGDWITMAGGVEGQVIEINWRATRVRTLVNDIIVVPNSVVAKTVVTTHRPLIEPRFCCIELQVEQGIDMARVIKLLEAAAAGALGTYPGGRATAYATALVDTLVTYQLWFAVSRFPDTATVRSAVIGAVLAALRTARIKAGGAETVVRMIREDPAGSVG